MVIRVPDPFSTLLSAQRAMDLAFNRDWFGARAVGAAEFPAVNVFRDGEDFVLVAEVPGVKKDDLDIEVRGDTVRVQGKKSVVYDENASLHRRERSSGRFDRTLKLPAQIDAEKATAECRDGVLTVRLPRAESERARTVTIN